MIQVLIVYNLEELKIVNPMLIKNLHRLFNDNDVEFYCCSYDELDLGDG